jgi:hypothetical protein
MKTIITSFKALTLLIMLSASTLLRAGSDDSSKVDLSLGADLVNRYVWRGLLLGNSASIQPAMGITAGGFSFGTWASYTMSPSAFQEVDLYISYTIGSFTFGVNDYYNPNDSIGVSNDYFNYGNSTTLHSFEPFVTLSGIGGTAFSATAGVFVYGNDRDEKGDNQFSSYVELSYAANVKDYGLNFFGGATMAGGYYADKASVVNLGVSVTKEIKLTDRFALPCKGSFIVNPNAQNVFLVFGFTF